MPTKKSTVEMIPADLVRSCIFLLGNQRVILDSDLARLYGVTTKRLNEQVKRNSDRFPRDFAFRLTWKESESLRAQFVALNPHAVSRSQNATLKRGTNIKYRPLAFTEHGAIMAATVL